jgi:hypothetical protein
MAEKSQFIQDSNQKQLSPSRAGSRMTPEGKTVQNYGLATKFEKGKYSIDSTTYPDDLYSNQGIYGGNYVVFYINVADDSKLLAEKAVSTVEGDIPPRLRGDLIGQNLSKLEGGAAQATAGAAAGVGLQGAQTILTGGKGSWKDAGEKGLVGGAIGAAQGGTVAAASGGMARQQKRITTAIALHVPNQLSINYSMDWQTDDTFMYQAAAMANREVAKAVTTGGAKSNVLGTAGSILTNMALQGPGGGALSAASGLAANPKKEQVFKNVNFREFTVDYTFAPRNPTEAANVRKIINNFKLHMHPEYKDLNNFVFIYPSEFDIYYYQGGQENLNLHRHPSCVLKNMTINYTPNGAFNTFDDGMPTQINVTLQFLELAILTKAQIQDNF